MKAAPELPATLLERLRPMILQADRLHGFVTDDDPPYLLAYRVVR